MDKPCSCIWDYVSHTPPGLNLGKLDYTIRPVWQPCQTDSRLSFCLRTDAALRHSSTKIHFVWREKAESEEHYLQPRAIAEIKSIFLFYILFLHLLDIWKILPKQTNIRLQFWKLFNTVLKAPICCHALAINSINSKDKISAEGRSRRVHMQDRGRSSAGSDGAKPLRPSHQHAPKETKSASSQFIWNLFYHTAVVNSEGTVKTPHTASPHISQCRRTMGVNVKYYAICNTCIKKYILFISRPKSHKAIGWGAETPCPADQCCAFYTHRWSERDRIWARPDFLMWAKPTFPVPPWLSRRGGLPAAAPAAINTRRQFHYSKP